MEKKIEATRILLSSLEILRSFGDRLDLCSSVIL